MYNFILKDERYFVIVKHTAYKIILNKIKNIKYELSKQTVDKMTQLPVYIML